MKKILLAVPFIPVFLYRVLHTAVFALGYLKPVYISLPYRSTDTTHKITHKGVGCGFWGAVKALFWIPTKENRNYNTYWIAKGQQEIYNGRVLKLWV